ncbi:MAG: bifunctional phosphoribosylaminoimidazolecarboxamide formyltransferase/inosine monophosphate cyclohydrolase [Verrucomicrobia bacterium]|nr:MAG: bifunctional phosphoribosylaminoimidazolecarboxamide formyltransferase/inosine monophosphate cyclohydrolase [Verrucomicrobiota bacterium]
MKLTRALISVSDKTDLIPFARKLSTFGIEIISTGGTAKVLQAEGIPVTEISKFTNSPEILEGRLKTLHPKVHGGLLYLRESTKHVKEAQSQGIQPIDLVVVNLYPFVATISKEGVTLEEAIEQIDIGGPAMIRSAAKNYQTVTVVTDPDDYASVLEDLEEGEGATTRKLRERLAIKAFATTSSYDAAITHYLNREQETNSAFTLELPLAGRLRYGENPHQNAELYGNFFDYFEKLHGKELSYNNILDIGAASELISEFVKPTVAILKHTNPCGVASDPDLKEAWLKAFATDKQAPFGGIIIANRPVTLALAKAIAEIFSEVIIAPDFEADARSLLQKKKNLRLMRVLQLPAAGAREIRSIPGGILVQDADSAGLGELEHKVVSSRPPDRNELEAMEFGWKVVKHVKSNAIVYASKDCTLGIGAGQMSRIDSSRIAAWKAQEAGLSLKGSAVCSDAFFPFADGLIAAADAGATTAIQPGGSVRDAEVIEAANQRDMAMIFTGTRHFKH